MDKRQRDQAARDYDLIQCRYLLGLLDQEWTKTYNSGDARPSKDTVKQLRKEARTAEKALTRLIVDLNGARVPVKLDGSALSDHMPHDFISTLRSVNEELGTFGHSWTVDAVQQGTLIADLRLLRGLLNRF